jgi:hypothetical protein
MSTNHDDFEVLCAVAASGHLSNAERAELSEHLRNCISCQNRLFEMRQLAIPLLLARPLKTPGKPWRKGMQERFAERAIREGVPLSPRSQGVGFRALGMVTVVLVVLSLVTATLQDDPLRKSDVDPGASDAAQVHNPSASPYSIPVLPAGIRRFHREHRPSSAVLRMITPGSPTSDLAALPDHSFTFAPYARNSARRSYPLSTTIRLPEVVPSLTSSYRAPGLTLDTTSEVFRHNAPHLLAESDHGAFAPFHFRSNLASQGLDLDAYRSTSKANFKPNGFELIYNVIPEAAGQERSQ